MERNIVIKDIVISSIDLYTVDLTLVDPFVTATSAQRTRTLLIVAVGTGTITGWGECSADGSTYCHGESAATARDDISSVATAHVGSPVNEPAPITALDHRPMAAAALESAMWDLYAKSQRQPLAEVYGGSVRSIASRAVIGRSDNLEDRAAQAIDAGYTAIKVKVDADDGLDHIAGIRHRYPRLSIAADFNGSLSQHIRPTEVVAEVVADLDALRLDFIEQPFAPFEDTKTLDLQQQIDTPICLDESVRTMDQAAWAHAHDMLINAKCAKFGGPTRSLEIVHAVDPRLVWWGGMLETGIGRAHSLALATTSKGTLPTDLAGSNRYYERDLTDPWNLADGGLKPNERPGIGVEVDVDWIASQNPKSRVRFS